jgi:cell wall-associated NlpC family hydrolase
MRLISRARTTRYGSSRARRGVVVCALAFLIAAVTLEAPVAGADPAAAPNTVASVTAMLHDLSQQNEALSEALNAAVADAQLQQASLAQAQGDASAAEATYEDTRAQLSATLTAQYEEGSSMSTAGALLTSSSSQAYVDKLHTLNLMSARRVGILQEVDAAKVKATTAQAAAKTLLAAANAKRDDIRSQQTTLAGDSARYETLLAKLTEQQRQAYMNDNSPTPAQVVSAITVHATTAGAQKAVDFALAQVNKRYRYGRSGPDAFDCSGLTMAAYAQVGLSLPHNAAAQYHYGTHVDASQLQPGDLVFLYHPITHVEIYIGGGLAVSAADEALGIRIVSVFNDMAHYVGATRLT